MEKNAPTTSPAPATQTNKTLTRHDLNGANMTVPITGIQTKQVSPLQKGRIVYVSIDPDPANGEVYIQGKGLALTKVGYLKLANAAGAQTSTKVIRTDSDYCMVEASISYTTYVGNRQQVTSLKEIDMDVVKEEIYSRPANQFEKNLTAPQLTEKRHTEYIQFKKHKLARCESGAVGRAVRSILGLKQVYTRDELLKPFVIPQLFFSPDFSDADVKKAVLYSISHSSNMLYGEESLEMSAPSEHEVLPPPVVTEIEEEPIAVSYESGVETMPPSPLAEAIDPVTGEVSPPPPPPAEKKEKPDYVTPPCPQCGGPTTYIEGQKNGKKWYGSFCNDESCIDQDKGFRSCKWGKLTPIDPRQESLTGHIPAEGYSSSPGF